MRKGCWRNALFGNRSLREMISVVWKLITAMKGLGHFPFCLYSMLAPFPPHGLEKVHSLGRLEDVTSFNFDDQPTLFRQFYSSWTWWSAELLKLPALTKATPIMTCWFKTALNSCPETHHSSVAWKPFVCSVKPCSNRPWRFLDLDWEEVEVCTLWKGQLLFGLTHQMFPESSVQQINKTSQVIQES